MSSVRDKIFGTYDLQKNARSAQGEYIRRHTVAVWQKCPGNETYIGSATCIQIADRLFISTAAHNFEDIPNGGTVTLYSVTSGTPVSLQVIDQNHGEYGAEGTLDVAWMEIDPQSAAEEKVAGVSLDVVDSYHNTDIENGTYAILGFSPDFRRLGANPANTNSIPLVFGYLKPSKDTDPADDRLLLHLPKEVVKNQSFLPMSKPGGLSGGGIWSVPLLDDSPIWSLAKYRLAAMTIEHSHLSGEVEGDIIGLRMYHWLKFLLADHPELCKHIEPLLNRRA